jgi:hypothetical protein
VVGVRGAGGEGLATVFFLVGVSTEVVFFFKDQQVFAAEEVGCGEASDATAYDDDIGFAGGVGVFELVAVTDLVTNLKVLALNKRGGRVRIGCRQQSSVDRTTGGDGTDDNELDEITA